MSIERAVNLDEVRLLAKRYLPKIAFDFIEGGVDDELCLRRNREAFERYAIVPRYLVDVSSRDQTTSVLGQTYAHPFGVSPMGLAGLFRPNADLMLAEAAAAANIPYLMSSASNNSIEAAAKVAPNNTWFQIYGARAGNITEDLVRRARDAGLRTLVVTIDVPVNSNRERNKRNGFTRPLKMRPAILLEALGHPAWLIRYFRAGGIPLMENWVPYAPPGSDAGAVADLYGTMTPAPSVNWATLERIRKMWPENLAIKGILHPDDAVRAVDAGANAIIVSNHGGRQLDFAPSPLDMLPAVRDAIGSRAELIYDSGIRRGSDVIIAMCLGARMVLFGRPPLYGAAAAGTRGVARVLDILAREIDIDMTQIGCSKLSLLGPHMLRHQGRDLAPAPAYAPPIAGGTPSTGDRRLHQH